MRIERQRRGVGASFFFFFFLFSLFWNYRISPFVGISANQRGGINER